MVRQYGGIDLEKVLLHYRLIDFSSESKRKIICPFHEDLKPSMSVDLVNGMFYCFGCGVSGNVFDLIKLIHPEYNDIECMMEIERIVHSKEIEKLNIQKRKRKRENSKKALYEAYDYFYGIRKTDWNNVRNEKEKQVLEYMMKRGFNRKSLNVADCRVTLNEDYPIIFPILDNGRFCGYVCRTMDKKVEEYRKYLYNDGMKKRGILCGTYEENKTLFVCEGMLDMLSIKTKGKVKNVVAFLGWHMSDFQFEKIRQKNITKIISCLDNPKIDSAGEKGLKLLRKYFDDVTPFPYPDWVKDPGEMNEKQLEESMKRLKHDIKVYSNG